MIQFSRYLTGPYLAQAVRIGDQKKLPNLFFLILGFLPEVEELGLEVLKLSLQLSIGLPLLAQRLHQALLVAQVRLQGALQLGNLDLQIEKYICIVVVAQRLSVCLMCKRAWFQILLHLSTMNSSRKKSLLFTRL